jgi:hypothetical protein
LQSVWPYFDPTLAIADEGLAVGLARSTPRTQPDTHGRHDGVSGVVVQSLRSMRADNPWLSMLSGNGQTGGNLSPTTAGP